MSLDPLLTWKGQRVRFPGDGPEAITKKVHSAQLRPGSLFFIPSPLEGWGVDTLLQNLPVDSVVVLQELDPELRSICTKPLAEYLGPLIRDIRLFWLEDDTEEAIQTLFETLPIEHLRRCEFFPLNGAWMSRRTRYRQVFDRFDRGLVQFWLNRMTCIHMGPLWVRNLFDNLSRIQSPWQPWPQWGDVPVLVCGAGVSLEKVLPWAVQSRSKIKIIAVDTALSILKDWNIVPDAVVCLESQHANLRDFIGWSNRPIDLFTDLTSFPPSTRILGGNVYWFISRFTKLQLWDRWPWAAVPIIPPMGSVGVAAVWIGQKISNGQLILSGLDFSYPLGKTHARGAPSIKTLMAKTNRLQPMEQSGTWYGKANKKNQQLGWVTTPIMESYSGVLSEILEKHSSKVWKWCDDGMPLGIPVWPRSSLVVQQELNRNLKKTVHVTEFSDIKDWLKNEVSDWEIILKLFDEMNNAPEDEGISDRLISRLKTVDYLTFSFGDPKPRKSSDWLSRAKLQIIWILTRNVNERITHSG